MVWIFIWIVVQPMIPSCRVCSRGSTQMLSRQISLHSPLTFQVVCRYSIVLDRTVEQPASGAMQAKHIQLQSLKSLLSTGKLSKGQNSQALASSSCSTCGRDVLSRQLQVLDI